jgi:superfamily II DNA or RNA helicase
MEPGFNVVIRRTRRNYPVNLSDVLNSMVGIIEAPPVSNVSELRRLRKLDAPKTTAKITRCPKGTRKNQKTGNCEPFPPVISVEKVVSDLDAEHTEKKEEFVDQEKPDPNLFLEDPRVSQEDYDDSEPTALDRELNDDLEKDFEEPKIPQNQPIVLNDLLSKIPKESNQYIRVKEKIEYDQTKSAASEYPFLYPDLNDPNFAVKIASRKEFNDFKYDGEIKSIEETADILCKSQFELLPHQIFVKNFLSFQTPYNSLLLYHGLGSGKTCSAIGIAEEMRGYMKQVGIRQRIIVVASPNVQQNFRMQLFDERGLTESNGVWTIRSCIGDSLIREVNPTNLKGMKKERVISQIKTIINQYYVFMGYTELANYIAKKTAVPPDSGFSAEDQSKMEKRNIRKLFNNRLIIIDEIHNVRDFDENKDWKTAKSLTKLAKFCDNLRFLLLSATPMYNSYKEIIWLINLMNLNDKRGAILEKEVFDSEGNFISEKRSADGKVVQEGGKELLHRKMIGYVSYVRGENPYTFPYRIYPADFAKEKTFVSNEEESVLTQVSSFVSSLGQARVEQPIYPKLQLNMKPIDLALGHVPVYLTNIGEYQERAYRLILNTMRKDANEKGDFSDIDKFGFRTLKMPLEALNMVYPSEILDQSLLQGKILDQDSAFDEFMDAEDEDEDDLKNPLSTIVGKRGLNAVMNYVDESNRKIPMRYNFNYKPEVLEKYGRIFQRDQLPKYSSKIADICDSVLNSTGIVLIYSQYIDGGVVPIALALEEMGFTRFGSAEYTKPLFESPPVEPLDAKTMKPRSQLAAGAKFSQAKYVMITGRKEFSPQNAADVKHVIGNENKNGEYVKVILISKAGSEGLDFKNIRQVHILEPWYNMNRIEQIIGRGVRNMSHCSLPFTNRNVEIYLHGTLQNQYKDEECADLYVYRLAEKKAVQIGRVTRLMKEVAVDCLVNIGQTNFTMDKLAALAQNKNIELTLSTGNKKIVYKIGDRPYTDLCDYMDSCEFKCNPTAVIEESNLIQDTYDTKLLQVNQPRIMQRIRDLFKDKVFYNRVPLMNAINIVKQYPIEQIYSALTAFIKNKNEYLVDKYGRRGNLINRGEVYSFQPVEINDESISVFERTVPVDYKRDALNMEIPKDFKPVEKKKEEKDKQMDVSKIVSNEEEYVKLIREMNVNYSSFLHTKELMTGEKDWYKQAHRVINILQAKHDVGFDELEEHIIKHMVDMLLPREKMILVSYIYERIRGPADPEHLAETQQKKLETAIKTYLDTKLVNALNKRGIVIAGNGKWSLYIQSEDDATQWSEGETEDIRLFISNGAFVNLIKRTDDLSNVIGFINMQASETVMRFRVKDLTHLQNNTGTRIDNQIKSDIVKRINLILGENAYTDKNVNGINSMGFSIILEILMRQMTEDRVGGKMWFLDPETALVNTIQKYKKKK